MGGTGRVGDVDRPVGVPSQSEPTPAGGLSPAPDLAVRAYHKVRPQSGTFYTYLGRPPTVCPPLPIVDQFGMSPEST